ncbi:unnamed protein product [Polarella glacialis]|uniref:RING-type domain-containing protein n=1 Tax=Polarella glacialis TaxID=89957 RepID=A0A813DEA9_POLGL|nr:unnamed protein product [Polarella glacialis]
MSSLIWFSTFTRFSLLGAALFYVSDASPSCDFTIFRNPKQSGLLPRIAPASDAGGLVVAWQDGQVIMMQRFTPDCKSIGDALEVNRSQEFWRSPSENGLADAASLGNGIAVVAWVLNGDVWVSTAWVSTAERDAKFGTPVQANSPESFDRAEARILANPNGEGFVVAWSSWGQDGDGWGVFARHFDAHGQTVGSEQQVNQQWKNFQWQPQLAWCGASLWALWANSVADKSGEGRSNTGPLLRNLGSSSGQWNPGPEITLQGRGPGKAALSCGAGDAAAVIWLEDGGNRVVWNVSIPPPGQEAKSTVTESHVAARGAQLSKWHLGRLGPPTFSAWNWNHSFTGLQLLATQVLAKISGRRTDVKASEDNNGFLKEPVAAPASSRGFWAGELASAWKSRQSVGGQTNGSESSAIRLGQPGPGVGTGQIDLLAQDGRLLLMTTAGDGKLEVQLLNYAMKTAEIFPVRGVAAGAQQARAAWDPLDPSRGSRAILLCWVAGDPSDPDNTPSFQCLHRGESWLMGEDGVGMGGDLIVVIVLTICLTLCILKQCTQGTRFGRRNRAVNVGGAEAVEALNQQRSERSAARARMQNLREQIAQIPMVPLSNRLPAPESAAPESATAPGARTGPGDASTPEVSPSTPCDATISTPTASGTSRDPCPICQNEVLVRVALQRCGHTACRDCTLRLVELALPCHICRGPIGGVLPVYI